MLAGYQVFEALFADEVLHLLETEHIDVVVIAHDVVDPEIAEVQRRVVTLRLEPQATAKDVVWELSQLLPGEDVTLQ
jgi:ABC-type nitrate/sulfonate/bicarbonate transport system ATPase subunit